MPGSHWLIVFASASSQLPSIASASSCLSVAGHAVPLDHLSQLLLCIIMPASCLPLHNHSASCWLLCINHSAVAGIASPPNQLLPSPHAPVAGLEPALSRLPIAGLYILHSSQLLAIALSFHQSIAAALHHHSSQ